MTLVLLWIGLLEPDHLMLAYRGELTTCQTIAQSWERIGWRTKCEELREAANERLAGK